MNLKLSLIILLIILIFTYLITNRYLHNKIKKVKTKYIFIHIPKSGGYGLDILLTTHLKENYNKIHLEKIKPVPNEKYIIWIRNPITRFVSAFNYIVKFIKEPFIYEYIEKDFNFMKTFSKFKNANDLAEKIYSDKDAFKLLSNDSTKTPMCMIKRWWLSMYKNHFCPEDMFKGISWYLDDHFLKNHHKKILFCGQLEYFEEDVAKLCKLLNIENTYKPYNINTLKLSKYLSPLAIKNLKKFYLNDYKCLDKLVYYGLINKERLNEYY